MGGGCRPACTSSCAPRPARCAFAEDFTAPPLQVPYIKGSISNMLVNNLFKLYPPEPPSWEEQEEERAQKAALKAAEKAAKVGAGCAGPVVNRKLS